MVVLPLTVRDDILTCFAECTKHGYERGILIIPNQRELLKLVLDTRTKWLEMINLSASVITQRFLAPTD